MEEHEHGHRFINLTGHHISIIDVNSSNIIRSNGTDYCYEEDITIIEKIEPTARLDTFVEGEDIIKVCGIPVAKNTKWRVDNWNPKWKDQWLIVSSLSRKALAALALTKMSRVLVPDRIVRDIRNPSRILGCRGLTTR